MTRSAHGCMPGYCGDGNLDEAAPNVPGTPGGQSLPTGYFSGRAAGKTSTVTYLELNVA